MAIARHSSAATRTTPSGSRPPASTTPSRPTTASAPWAAGRCRIASAFDTTKPKNKRHEHRHRHDRERRDANAPGRIEQDEAAEDEGRDPRDRPDPETRHLQLDHEEHDGGDQERDPDQAHRQEPEGRDRDQQQDRSERAAEDVPGHDQLEDDQGEAEPEEDEGEVRIEQCRGGTQRPGVIGDIIDRRVGGVRGSPDAVRDDRRPSPSTRVQELALGVGDQVDDVAIEGFLGRDALRLRHERLGELRVASPLLGELPHRRRRVLLDLASERHPADPDGRGRAHVGGRRHGGDVAGHQDEGSRRCGPRAFRRDVADHRGRGCLDRLDDLLHRGAETPGCIDRDEHRGGPLRPLDTVRGDSRRRRGRPRPRARGGSRCPVTAGRTLRERGRTGRPRRRARHRPAFGRSSTSRSPWRSCAYVVSCDAPAYPARFARFSSPAGRFPSRRNRGNIGARHCKLRWPTAPYTERNPSGRSARRPAPPPGGGAADGRTPHR